MVTSKDIRIKKEDQLAKDKKEIPYPSLEELHQEDWEQKPYAIMTIFDKAGAIVRRIKTTPSNGMNRLVWDFRYESLIPVQLTEPHAGRYSSLPTGALAAPGEYFAQLTKVHNGKVTVLTDKVPFKIKSLNNATLSAADKDALTAFELKLTKMRRAGRAAGTIYNSMNDRVAHLEKGILLTANADLKLLETVEKIRIQLKKLAIVMYGDGSLSSREFETAPGLFERMESPIWNMWDATSAPSETAQKNYNLVGKMFEQYLKNLDSIKTEINQLEKQLNELGAPYTAGRLEIPDWKME